MTERKNECMHEWATTVVKDKSLPAAVKMLLGPASNELHKSAQPLTVLLPANYLYRLK